jgi:hypothetical protein
VYMNTITSMASAFIERFYGYRHRECKIGGAYMMLGDAAKDTTITKEMFTRWEDDSETAAAIDAAAEMLRKI